MSQENNNNNLSGFEHQDDTNYGSTARMQVNSLDTVLVIALKIG